MNQFQGTLKYFAAKMHAFRPLANATAVIISAAVLSAVGCKHKHPSEETTSKIVLTPRFASGPTNFIAQIAGTDHIILVLPSRFQERMPTLRNYTLTLSGDNMNRALFGITSLEKPQSDMDSGAMYDWEIQFCRDPEILAKADFQDDLVRIGTVEYRDRSGEIRSIYGMLQEDSNRWRKEHQ